MAAIMIRDDVSSLQLRKLARRERDSRVVRYNAEGITGLRDEPRSGRPPYLTEGEQASLKAMVLRPPGPEGPSRWRIVDLQQIIETRWGVRYSESGLWRLLQSLDMSLQKPRPVHPEADPAAQAAFKKTLQKSLVPSSSSILKPAALRSGFRTKHGSGKKVA